MNSRRGRYFEVNVRIGGYMQGRVCGSRIGKGSVMDVSVPPSARPASNAT